MSFEPTHILEAAVQNSEEREPSTSDGKGDLLGSLSSSFTLQASHSLLSPLHKQNNEDDTCSTCVDFSPRQHEAISNSGA